MFGAWFKGLCVVDDSVLVSSNVKQIGGAFLFDQCQANRWGVLDYSG